MLGIHLRRSNKKPIFALFTFVAILVLSGRINTPISNIQDNLKGVKTRVKIQQRNAGSLASRVLSKQNKAEQLEQLEQHIYRNDGLLQVNPSGPHPIFELIQSAQSAWDRKLERASPTLQDAVDEYYRRYSRRPPRGFGDW